MVSLKVARERTILESIYNLVGQSNSHSQWVSAVNYDGRTLRGMWGRALIDYSDNMRFVTLTEKGVGVLFFGEENAGEILAFM